MSDDTAASAPDFRLLFEGTPVPYLVLSPNLAIVAVNDAYLRATMTKRDEILDRGIFEVFPDNPSDPVATGVANLRASLARALSTRRGDTMAVQKYDIRRPESEGGGYEERYWSPVNTPVLGPNGEVAYVIHRVEDVTDFVRLKQEGTAQHIRTEELLTRNVAMEAELFSRAQEIQAANRELREFHAELEMRVLARTVALRKTNDELQREIGERRRAQDALRDSEEQLRQSQKLEAVGRLAGGVAHDFNNLLTVILGYTSTLRSVLKPKGFIEEGLHEIQRAAERAALLTKQLLAFSRRQVLDPAVLDLNEIVTELQRMLTRVLGEDIELQTTLGAALHPIRADRGQLEQVIMNLVVNARDAMPGGGVLQITTANAEVTGTEATETRGLALGSYTTLCVSDNGSGMDEETRARAFEPFFTTKERGQNSGLGLSTVFGIVKQSGGDIRLHSAPGRGTTFVIYLPACEGVPDKAIPRPALRS